MSLKKIALCVLVLTLITIFFPACVTLLMNNQSDSEFYKTVKSGKSIVLNNGSETMDVEEFIPCAMMGQLSIDDDEALLETFAIVLRTYIYNTMAENSTMNADILNIPYMSHDEMKSTWKSDFTNNINKLNKIISNTSLLVIRYNNDLINPYYHTLSCGTTRDSVEEYINPVICEADLTDNDYLNTSVYSYDSFIKTIKSLNPDITISATAPLETFQVISKDSAGYVTELQIGGVSIDINTFLDAFSLPSACFEVDEYNGGIRLISKGVGHGYGISLHTAKIMAKNGSSYEDIIAYFYQGVVVGK
jgi:stage II sporulation protein D